MQFIELKQKDIKRLKKLLHDQNNGVCPLLKKTISLDEAVLDHIHKLKSEPYAANKGTIRNSIEFRCNALEGKISNNWKRYFGADESKHPISLPDFLRNLADYLEAGPYNNNGTYYVHPSEVPKKPKVKKSAFNKMLKLFKLKYPKKKLPIYPKSCKLTKGLGKLFEEFCITDIYYKD